MNNGINSLEGYLTLKQILDIIPVSRSTWYRGMEEGIYPRQHRISKGRVGWAVAEIRQCELDIAQGANQTPPLQKNKNPNNLPTTA